MRMSISLIMFILDHCFIPSNHHLLQIAPTVRPAHQRSLFQSREEQPKLVSPDRARPHDCSNRWWELWSSHVQHAQLEHPYRARGHDCIGPGGGSVREFVHRSHSHGAKVVRQTVHFEHCFSIIFTPHYCTPSSGTWAMDSSDLLLRPLFELDHLVDPNAARSDV